LFLNYHFSPAGLPLQLISNEPDERRHQLTLYRENQPDEWVLQRSQPGSFPFVNAAKRTGA
jgi:hypothetical protein